MRLSSFLLLLSLAQAQSIQVKTGITNSQDYYADHPASGLSGDTYYWTAWAANATGMPNASGLPIYGTFNDGSTATCATSNIGILQLDVFSWSTPANTSIRTVNCMSSFGVGGATNTPTGWSGHCTGVTDSICGWKSGNPFYKTNFYLPVQRQVSTGTSDPAHDATIVMSPDKGVHFCNPYDLSINAGVCDSAVWDANGAAPKASGDASYPTSIIWPNLGAGFWSPRVIQYGQDGSYPAGVEPYCEPTTYTCFIFENGVVARWPNVDLAKLDKTTLEYYKGVVAPNYIPDGNNTGNWDTNIANAKRVARFFFLNNTSVDNSDFVGINELFSVVYLKEFKCYVATGYTKQPGPVSKIYIATASSPLGPWITRYIGTGIIGFFSLSLPIAYTVNSTNPPDVLATFSSNANIHAVQHTPYFTQYDLSLGLKDYGTGRRAAQNPNSSFIQNRGHRFSAGNSFKSFPKKNLIWAFDFLDGGANNASMTYPYFRDVANNSAFMQFYGSEYHIADGVQTFNTGDTEGLYSVTSDVNGKANPTALNIPVSLQGNSSLTVVGVFRLDTGGYPYGPFWSIGDQGGTGNTTNNNSFGLYWNGSTMELRWGGRFIFTYKANSSFTPTVGNWYFYATTITANGATPSYSTWVGCGISNNIQCLTDIMIGVSRASTGGSPTQTPSISAGQLVLGNDSTPPETLNASYAGIQIFSGVLSMQDIKRIYTIYKNTLSVTVQ